MAHSLDLTGGSIAGSMLRFALPMMAGNLLQQCYNIADTMVVGRFLGPDALAAVGSAFTLMTFLTSVLLGLCMGSGAVFSMRYGARDLDGLRRSIAHAFWMIALAAVLLNLASFALLRPILRLLQVPGPVYPLIRQYLEIIFWGILATFLYNFFACLLRAVGNSAVPLAFLALSALGNLALDLWFVLGLGWGVRGAAAATVIAQWAAAAGIAAYTLARFGELRPAARHWRWNRQTASALGAASVLTSLQQSVMNFGILMVQGLVNSFGPAVMAAFAAAVKIDSFAYMPMQDFGNAFSTFIAQNHGAGKPERIRQGVRDAAALAVAVGLAGSALVCVFAPQLLAVFVGGQEAEILAIGTRYLRIEGAFYWGIGLLFLLYGYYRAVGRPGMSLVLTIVSLGTRVALAYALAPLPAFGVTAIWAAVPIGWVLADLVGFGYYARLRAGRPYTGNL